MTENDLTEFRRLIAKRKGATGTVTNSAALPTAASREAARIALQARADLVAAQAQLLASKTKLHAAQARIAAAARQPETKPTAPTAVPGLSPRDQRRAAAQGTISDQSDSQLQFIAGHRSAIDADRSAARAELEKRGWTIHPSGSFSQSIRKAPRR